jgi:hypothetical protein
MPATTSQTPRPSRVSTTASTLLLTILLAASGCGSDNTAQIPENPLPSPGAPQPVDNPEEPEDSPINRPASQPAPADQ